MLMGLFMVLLIRIRSTDVYLGGFNNLNIEGDIIKELVSIFRGALYLYVVIYLLIALYNISKLKFIYLNIIALIISDLICYIHILNLPDTKGDTMCREPRVKYFLVQACASFLLFFRGVRIIKLYRNNKKTNYSFSSYKTRGSSFLFLVFMGRGLNKGREGYNLFKYYCWREL
ncbi:hypothetical protein Avbf_01902 [Armadillidium vulgare]|nr:hypothetical protein Avbf_01902 [Armadillidium vulgare]